MKNALIIEDTQESRDWMRHMLNQAFPGIDTDCSENRRQAMERLAQRQYDLALVDLRLPDGSGIDIIASINRQTPRTLSVVVSIYGDDQHLFPALQAGAQGYLLKDMPDRQFVRRLQGIINGEPPLSPAIARRLLDFFARSPVGDSHDLSPREREVLTLIAQGHKLAEVAENLSISPHTAGDHVKSIYRKLNISSRAEATLVATRLGLISSV